MLCCICNSWFGLTFIFTAIFFYVSKKNPEKINGIYSIPGRFYWFKVIAFTLLLKLRKWKDERARAKEDKERDHTKAETYNAGLGYKSKISIQSMEKVQPLSDHFQAIDAIYFNGADEKGFYFVTGTARRPHAVINGFMIFRIPDLGTLISPKLPDSILFGGSEEHFGAEGFSYKPIEPMKHWKVEYNGKLKMYGDESKKEYEVVLKADWKSDLQYFDFDSMIPDCTLAKAISLESWSREFFENLKKSHQTHYEQHGNLIGEIKVDGKSHKFNIPSMRDHTYAIKRDWKNIYRYIMHMFSLKDGRRFNIGNVCYPSTSSRLEIGYMYDFDGSLHALTSVDMPLWAHGEGGTPPTDYGFRFFAANGKDYYVEVKVIETQDLFIGWEWEARIVERRCKFRVNGSEGFGVSECCYRNTSGRPDHVAASDPAWVKDVKTVE